MIAAAALEAPLNGPFHTPPSPEALRPSPATLELVDRQVDALLAATPSFHEMSPGDQMSLRKNLVNVAAYAAECMRDICWQSEQLRQVPVIRRRESYHGPIARAQEAGRFEPRAASQIGRVTSETLRAVAFPTFVADLIHGTFNAITQSNIKQMEAFTSLLENVGKTVDSFMQSNVSDDQARDWLASRYPQHIAVREHKLAVADGADDREAPNFRADLNLSEDVGVDESAFEETLLPAARRRLAETRLQMLSTMVLMGFSRIVVTGGKIRATMAFHIDTTDRSHEESATDLDFRVQAAAQGGMGWWSASVSTSLSYVSSQRASSDAEINTQTDLTGEVELHFKSDYFPLTRFANGGAIGRIQANTAVPDANAPSAEAGGGGQFAAPPQAGGDVPRAPVRRTPRQPAQLRPIGAPLPPVRTPDAVTPVTPVRRPSGENGGQPATEQPAAGQPAQETTSQPVANQPAAEQPAPEQPVAATAAGPGRIWRAYR
jgi:hypothetical protein